MSRPFTAQQNNGRTYRSRLASLVEEFIGWNRRPCTLSYRIDEFPTVPETNRRFWWLPRNLKFVRSPGHFILNAVIVQIILNIEISVLAGASGFQRSRC